MAALLEHRPDLQITAFVNDTYHELEWQLGDSVRVVDVKGGSIRNRYKWTLEEFFSLPRIAEAKKVDILHSLGNFAPLHGHFRRVVTVHDAPGFHLTSKHILLPIRMSTAAMVWSGAYRAERVITDSQITRQRLIDSGISRDRIDAVVLGIKHPHAPIQTVTDALKNQLKSEGKQIALTVGTNLPHKNLEGLVKAIANIPTADRPIFVFAGNNTDSEQLRSLAVAAGVKSDVRLLGRVSDDTLESLYSLANLVVLPTLHEGFGLPTVEAMMRSVPVVCSDLDIMREVAGDAALYFDPTRQEEMAAVIESFLIDPQVGVRLVARGRERAQKFTWRAAAEQTYATYLRTLSNPLVNKER